MCIFNGSHRKGRRQIYRARVVTRNQPERVKIGDRTGEVVSSFSRNDLQTQSGRCLPRELSAAPAAGSPLF